VDLGPVDEKVCEEILHRAGKVPVIFLHDYHTQIDQEKNMLALKRLLEISENPVGYSSPNLDSKLDFLSLGLGATVIEKRLILDRGLSSFHAHESMEPNELKAWVDEIRSAANSLGVSKIIPTTDDLRMSKSYFRSLFTINGIKKGDIITDEMLIAKRPGTGISTSQKFKIVGKIALTNIPANTMMSWDMLDEQ
jgi:sialic acid synthase SpsE